MFKFTKVHKVLTLVLVMLAVLLGVGMVGSASALGPNAMRPGFNSTVFAGNDDDSVGPVGLGFTVNFFGVTRTQAWVNNNGNITLDGALWTYTPFDLTSTGSEIIAPFFADVDTRNSAAGDPVRYGTGTVGGRAAFGVTYSNVDCYYTYNTTNLGNNYFQVILIDRSDIAPGDFDIEFNYDQIRWEAGTASSGNIQCLGGYPARVGWSNGTGAPGTSFELAGSGVAGAFLDTNPVTGLINNRLNSTQMGRYVFNVRGGRPVQADLGITKQDSADPVAIGQVFNYTLTVSNAGLDPATGVVVTDTLPAAYAASSATPSQGSCALGAPVVCNLGTVGVGANATVVISGAATAGGLLTNTASVSANEADPISGNNQATQTTTVITNQPPTANPGGPYSGIEGSPVSFNGAASSDPEGGPLIYQWTFGDGGIGTGPTPTHTYADNGAYAVSLTVTDSGGLSNTGATTASIANVAPTIANAFQVAPIPEGSTPSNGNLVVQATDPAGPNDPLSFDFDCDNNGSFETPAYPGTSTADCSFDDNGSYPVGVRVSDDDGGVAVGSITAVVTNVPPTAFLPNSGPVGEGSPATLTFEAQVDPSNADTAAGFHYSIACDGNPGSLATSYGAASASPSAMCTYPDNGIYPVVGRILDKDDGASDYQATVTVNNVAPSVDAGPDATINEGDTFSSTGSFTDPGADSWSATVDYGDGSGVGPLALNPDKTFSLSHTYADNGTYTVTVTVTDDDGGVGSDSAQVTVNNVAPTVDAGPDVTINEGDTFSSAGSLTDPGADSWSATVDYGDGSGVSPLALNPDKTFSLSHTYADNGAYTVTVAVTDDGGVGNDTAVVTVKNVAPTVNAGPDATINEGDTFSSAGSFTDPGADFWTATVDYGDGSGVGPLALNPDKTFSLSHTYADNGAYTVTVTVTDDDGGVGSDSAQVTVNNVAPSVDAGPDAIIQSGQSLVVNATFTDPGLPDTHTATIDWGNGPIPAPVAQGQGSGSVSGIKQYLVPGTYTITVCVTDDDGGVGCDSLVVTVKRLEVKIDIKPGSFPNSINIRNKGNVPVGVFSGTYGGVAFDATTIVRGSLNFAGARDLGIGKSPQDLDGDGDMDQVFHFDTPALNLPAGSVEGCLTGVTASGVHFIGCDSVRIIAK